MNFIIAGSIGFLGGSLIGGFAAKSTIQAEDERNENQDVTLLAISIIGSVASLILSFTAGVIFANAPISLALLATTCLVAQGAVVAGLAAALLVALVACVAIHCFSGGEPEINLNLEQQ